MANEDFNKDGFTLTFSSNGVTCGSINAMDTMQYWCDNNDFALNSVEIVDQNLGRKEEVDVEIKNPEGYLPDKVIFNGDTTICVEDNEKYIVRCGEGDKFNPTFGFLYAYFLMHTGMSKTKAAKFFEKIESDYIEIPDFKKNKDVEKVVNDKTLTLDEYEKEMRRLIDDIIFEK